MGVYWAKAAAKNLTGQIEIVDLRTLFPLDEALIFETVKKHGRCLVLTEEPQTNSFAEALAGRISKECFRWLDAPLMFGCIGSARCTIEYWTGARDATQCRESDRPIKKALFI
jgi:pyruvate/2-oxoglutarate/acetoin dehydrogenase E1 component